MNFHRQGWFISIKAVKFAPTENQIGFNES